jgi:hypothetical protein
MGWAGHSLVEKPKVGELQMDWLRSEDLKEENMHLLSNHYSIPCICSYQKW